MQTGPWRLLACLAAFLSTACAQENVMQPSARAASGGSGYVKLDTFNFKAIVPEPPAAGSLAAQADLEAVLQAQVWRTPEQIGWAKVVEKDAVFNLADILGSWFQAERVPLTSALFKKLGDDIKVLDAAAKKPFQRPRPSAVDARIQPCVTVPASTSYPSGAAMQALIWSELLGEMVPAKRDELMARAQRAGWGRVIGGVHFPSDLVAGQWIGRAYLAECRKSPAFLAALDACKKELEQAAR